MGCEGYFLIQFYCRLFCHIINLSSQASEQGHKQIVDTLVGLGANKAIHDNKNRTPSDVAKSEEIKKILSYTLASPSLFLSPLSPSPSPSPSLPLSLFLPKLELKSHFFNEVIFPINYKERMRRMMKGEPT